MKFPRPLMIVSGSFLLALFVLVQAYRGWKSSQAFPEGLIQVNGRIEGDRVTLSSKFPGRLESLNVREGDFAHKGEVVLKVSDPQTEARRDQARAELAAAEAQGRGQDAGLSLTVRTTDAQVLQARAVVDQADTGIAAARADVARAEAALSTSEATAEGAESGIATAAAAEATARAEKARTEAGYRSCLAQVENAMANLSASGAGVDAARAALEKAELDAKRYVSLASQGAVSRETAERATTAGLQAKAHLESARQGWRAAQSLVSVRQSEVEAARQAVLAADAGIAQARAQRTAAARQANAARRTVDQMRSQLLAARQNVEQAAAKKRQTLGQLGQAQTAPQQVAVSRSAQAQAKARTQLARAALGEIGSVLKELTVRAPISGTVTTRLQDVGETVAAGAPLLEMVDLDRLYLKVYVPEHLIGKLRLGLPARVYTDAFPDRPFPARVGFVASEAEFTPKEVQTQDERVKLVYAVKLYLDGNPQRRLTPGLPADAVIRWKGDVPWSPPRR